MAFSIDSTHLPRIYGYNHVREWFNNNTPIRGGDQSMRRLGKRNDATKWLKHEIRDGVEVYVAGFHQTDIVTYYPTHYELYMGGWDSKSSMLFITAVTGNRCGGVPAREYIPSGYPNINEATVLYNGYPMHASGRFKFAYDDTPLSDLPTLRKYKVDRKKMTEVRKIAKPFLQYMTTMTALSPDEVTRDNNWHMDVIEALQDEAKWWDLFNHLSWRNHVSNYVHGRWYDTRSEKHMRNEVDKRLKIRFAVDVLKAV